MGGGTIKFLKDYTQKVHFTGIDLFEDFEPDDSNTHISPTFKLEDVRKSLGDSVELIKCDSADVLPTLNGRYDMVFLDGNHTYNATMEDFNNSVRLLTDGGYIAFHNCSVGISPDKKYILRDGGPWRAPQEIGRLPDFHLEVEVERVRVFNYRVSK